MLKDDAAKVLLAVDKLGEGFADRNLIWTPVERKAFEAAVKILKKYTKPASECTKKEWSDRQPRCPYCGEKLRTLRRETLYDDELAASVEYFWMDCSCKGLEMHWNPE